MSSTTTTTTITAANVTTLFPDVRTSLIGADLLPTDTSSSSQHEPSDDLEGYDAEQIRLMDEVCIVLDSHDNAIGSASKKACHLMSNINQGLLHRAFSCFLFDGTTKKLLLQQRATEKITFPDMWTNTCCSHPLAHPSEAGPTRPSGDPEADLIRNVEGAKRAAVRKLGHELGIPAGQVPVEEFRFLTRIHYLAASDGRWGEHEIDYILFIEVDDAESKLEVQVNRNEVRDVRWVEAEELRGMFREEGTQSARDGALKYTPWFRLICESMLFEWWDALHKGDLGRFVGDGGIKRLL